MPDGGVEAGDDVAPLCMSRLIWSPAALRDVHRVYRFLAPKKIDAAKCAVKAIRDGDRVLVLRREIARPTQNMDSEYREWQIDFGHSRYVTLYHYDGQTAVVVAQLHHKESSY